MIALLVADRDPLDRRAHAAVAHGETIGRVVVLRVAAALALQHQGKRRIAADVDPRDVVHLEGDFQRHARPRYLRVSGPMYHAALPSARRIDAGEMARQAARERDDHVETQVEAGRGRMARKPERGGAGDAPAAGAGVTASIASAIVGRCFTSTKAMVRPRRTMRSISPAGVL